MSEEPKKTSRDQKNEMNSICVTFFLQFISHLSSIIQNYI
ncbi:hypothetical protein D3OALGB2SA_1976 [Olavius algarvensis associated proteobacterium Delta 3]|nr:hypothetical protein D3OALGB2SA_1976 [Olavius algarvensis associated proteobacterium Delta 3]